MKRYFQCLVAAPESGQTAILFALMAIGLILFTGLAIDGGNVLKERRVTQNAADSAALSGVHYMMSSDAPSEQRLQMEINEVVEANGLSDTDGIPGNEVNDNVTIYYTDERGNRLETEPCWTVPCDDELPGEIPPPARGLEVVVNNDVDTFFMGLVNRNELGIGADAVAVARGGNFDSNELSNNALVAFGQCEQGDRPLDLSLYYADVIGGIHSATWFVNRGSENHYHGQVTYGEGMIDTADIPGFYEPAPAQADALGDPFEGLFTVDSFNCATGEIGSDPDLICHDVAQYAHEFRGEVNYRLMTQRPTREDPFLNKDTGELKEGIYYAGDYPIKFGWEPTDPEIPVGMRGTVTLVTNNYIKITERDVQLTGYMPANSVAPGLLLYSGLDMIAEGKACTNHEALRDEERPINTTGNTGTVRPTVEHDAEGHYVGHTSGSLVYRGIIYAPGGRAATSGHGATYEGAIVAYSIRVNGYVEYHNDPDLDCGDDVPCRPFVEPEVGALFVFDQNLYPQTQNLIYLDK